MKHLSILFVSLLFILGCQPKTNNRSTTTEPGTSNSLDQNYYDDTFNDHNNSDDSNDGSTSEAFNIKGRVSLLSLFVSNAHANNPLCISRCQSEQCAYLFVIDLDKKRTKICESSVDENQEFNFEFSSFPPVYEGRILETRVQNRQGKVRKFISTFEKDLKLKEQVVNEETTRKVESNFDEVIMSVRKSLSENGLANIQQLPKFQRERLSLVLDKDTDKVEEIVKTCDLASVPTECQIANGIGERSVSCVNGLPTVGRCEIIYCNSPFKLINGRCVSPTCSGSSQDMCLIENGKGIKTRECIDGKWSDYGACQLIGCKNGYQVEGDKCVKQVCQGPPAVGCNVANGSGYQKRRCVNGNWQTYGSCELSACDEGYSLAPDKLRCEVEVVEEFSPEIPVYISTDTLNPSQPIFLLKLDTKRVLTTVDLYKGNNCDSPSVAYWRSLGSGDFALKVSEDLEPGSHTFSARASVVNDGVTSYSECLEAFTTYELGEITTPGTPDPIVKDYTPQTPVYDSTDTRSPKQPVFVLKLDTKNILTKVKLYSGASCDSESIANWSSLSAGVFALLVPDELEPGSYTYSARAFVEKDGLEYKSDCLSSFTTYVLKKDGENPISTGFKDISELQSKISPANQNGVTYCKDWLDSNDIMINNPDYIRSLKFVSAPNNYGFAQPRKCAYKIEYVVNGQVKPMRCESRGWDMRDFQGMFDDPNNGIKKLVPVASCDIGSGRYKTNIFFNTKKDDSKVDYTPELPVYDSTDTREVDRPLFLLKLNTKGIATKVNLYRGTTCDSEPISDWTSLHAGDFALLVPEPLGAGTHTFSAKAFVEKNDVEYTSECLSGFTNYVVNRTDNSFVSQGFVDLKDLGTKLKEANQNGITYCKDWLKSNGIDVANSQYVRSFKFISAPNNYDFPRPGYCAYKIEYVVDGRVQPMKCESKGWDMRDFQGMFDNPNHGIRKLVPVPFCESSNSSGGFDKFKTNVFIK